MGRAIHAVDAGDPIGGQLRFAAVGEVFIADVEKLGPAPGEIHAGGDPLGAAVTADAMLVEDRLHVRRIVHHAFAPRFRLEPIGSPFEHGAWGRWRRRLFVFHVAADTGARHARGGLHERPHALDHASLVIERLKIERLARGSLEIGRAVFIHRHHAQEILGAEGQSAADEKRLIKGVGAGVGGAGPRRFLDHSQVLYFAALHSGHASVNVA